MALQQDTQSTSGVQIASKHMVGLKEQQRTMHAEFSQTV